MVHKREMHKNKFGIRLSHWKKLKNLKKLHIFRIKCAQNRYTNL